MKFRLVIIMHCLTLGTAQSFALEPKAPPSPASEGRSSFSLTPSQDDAAENIFIGHFGETVRLSRYWTVDAAMNGPMEVVNFHFAKVDPMSFDSQPFNPSKKDYVPEKFASLRLMQMLVIPKDAPDGFGSLKKLREAKANDLNGGGEIRELDDTSWPKDSFQVLISTPYSLFQLYSQNGSNFFIITSGAIPHDDHPADPMLAKATGRLTDSLSTFLYDPTVVQKSIIKDELPLLVRPLGALFALAGILWLLPSRRSWLRRLNRIGRAILLITAAWHAIAVPILFASLHFGLSRTINDSTILLCASILMPWVCWAASTRRWSALFWSALANVPAFLSGYANMEKFAAGRDVITGARDFWTLSVYLCLFGILNGIVFGLTQKDRRTNDGEHA